MFSRASAALLLPLTIFAATVAAELVIITEYASACSAVYTSGSRSLTVVQSTITVQPSPLSDQLILSGTPFVLELNDAVSSTPRKKRQSGKSYLQDNGQVTEDKNEAAPFHIDSNGQLNAGNGQVLSTSGIVRDMTFAVSPNTAAISTRLFTQNLTLVWKNEAFDGGMAEFYKHSGQNGDMILIHFSGPIPASWERISLGAVRASPNGAGPSGYGYDSSFSLVSTIISSGSTTIDFSATPGSSMLPSMGSMSSMRPSASSLSMSNGGPGSYPHGTLPVLSSTSHGESPSSTMASGPSSSSSSSGSSKSFSDVSAISSASSGSSKSSLSSTQTVLSSDVASMSSSSVSYASSASQSSITATSSSMPTSVMQASSTTSTLSSYTPTLSADSITSSPSSSPVSSSPSSSSTPTDVSPGPSSSSASMDMSSSPSSSSAQLEGSPTTESSPIASATGGTSEDGLCGTQWDGGFSCTDSLFGDCCSSYGYCGTGDDYCGDGCQTGFGLCDGQSAPSTTPEATSGSSSSSPEVSSSSISSGSPSSSTLPPFASSGGPIGPINPTVSSMISSSQLSSSATTSAISGTSSLPACPSATCATTATSSTTCDSPYGNSFELSCGTRNTGTVIPEDSTKRDKIPRALTNDVTECLTLCDKTPGCVGINFENGVCTRFSSITGTEPAPGSASASRSPGVTTTKTAPQGAPSTISSSSFNSVMSSPAIATTAISSKGSTSSQASYFASFSIQSSSVSLGSSLSASSSTVSSPTTSSGSPTGTSCPGINGGTMLDGHGNEFMIGCGADTSGNAFTRRTASTSWRDCFDACNAIASQGETCSGFTYVGGNDGEGTGYCNMKNQADLTFINDQGGIFVGAIKVSNGSMSSQPTSSSTATPPSSSLAASTSSVMPSNLRSSSVSNSAVSSSRSSTTTGTSSSLAAPATSSTLSSLRSSSVSSSVVSSSPSTTSAKASSSSSSKAASLSVSSATTNPYILPSPTPCNFGDNYIQDDSYCHVDLPFAVRMYQQSNSTIYASSNGFLTLGAGSASSAPQSLPADETLEVPPSATFPYWMDLCIYPGQSPSQAIFYQIGASGTNVTFEYYVGIGGHQSDGVVHFTVGYDSSLPGIWTYHYYSLGSPTGETANGKYASVGIQGLDQSGQEQSNQYSYRSAAITPGLIVVCNTNANTCVTQH